MPEKKKLNKIQYILNTNKYKYRLNKAYNNVLYKKICNDIYIFIPSTRHHLYNIP